MPPEVGPRVEAERADLLQHPDETLRGRLGVAHRPMAVTDRHAVIVRYMIQRPAAQVRQQPPRQLHRAQGPGRGHLLPGALDFGLHEPPVERDVVPDEHVVPQEIEHPRAHLAEDRLVLHHGWRDVRQSRDENRNRPLRVHERVVGLGDPAIPHHDRRDLRDPVPEPWRATRRLDVHHDVGQRCQAVRRQAAIRKRRAGEP